MYQLKRWLVIMLIVPVLLAGRAGTAVAQGREVSTAELQQLEEQAWAHYRAGRYEAAIPLMKRVLAIYEQALGPQHLTVAETLNSLAVLYYEIGAFDQAEPLYKRVLAIREKRLGREHPLVAEALNNLAESYRSRGDYGQAELLHKRAFAIRVKAANTAGYPDLDVATSLNNLGRVYSEKGDYIRAEIEYRGALGMREEILGPNHPDVAATLYNLAGLQSVIGDYSQAETLYKRALAIREKTPGPEHPDFAKSLNDLAEVYRIKGDYARAEPMYKRALAIFEKTLGPGNANVGVSLNNLAMVYHAKEDYEQAELLYKRALVILEKALGPEHLTAASVHNNLALLYDDTGDGGQAELLYKRALATREKVLGPEHPLVAESLTSLAALYAKNGDYQQAGPLLERGLKIFEKAFGGDHPQFFVAEHPQVATTLSNLAWLSRAKGDTAKAVQFLTRGNEIEEHNLRLILATNSENQKQLYLNTRSSTAHFAVSLHVRSAPQYGPAAQLALTTILQRKGRALDAMTDQIGILRRHATLQDQKLLDELAVTRSQLSTLQISAVGNLSPEERRTEVARLDAEAERLEGVVGRRSTEFLAQAQPITLDAVRQAIPADAALVEFFAFRWLGKSYYVAYVARRNEAVPQWVELGESGQIDADVELLRRALKDPKRTDVPKLARALDERVMQPIRKLLGSIQRVFLSPDGALNLIPFGALMDEKGNYLVENYSLTYLTSGRDLLRLQVQRENHSAAVVVADPLYDMGVSKPTNTQASPTSTGSDESRPPVDFTLLTYRPLPGTSEEAAALNKLWPDSRVLLKDKATEAALKQLNRPRVLHIATHGFFLAHRPEALPESDTLRRGTLDTFGISLTPPADWENPLLRSGLVLAGVKQGRSGAGEDGVLTALETVGLNLWGTKLVVLSACETGLGDVTNGAGVYGLRRALVLAGSETQVISLWKVSDAGTRDLMTAYYTRLKNGEGRAEAFRQVQLAMLRGSLSAATSGWTRETNDISEIAAMKDYRHPYYWAAFIPSGDWRSMDGK